MSTSVETTLAIESLGPARPRKNVLGAVSILLLSAALLWSYAPTIRPLISDWRGDDDYSAGQLVPLAALYLLWSDRRKLASCKVRPCWWGAGVILLAEAGRLYGLARMYESAERYGLVLAIIGVVLLAAGREVFWRLRWLLLFLFLMVPLPGRIHNSIAGPLQSLATSGGVVALELLGITVTQEGNVILLNDTTRISVAEACSGLRMLTSFVMVSAVLAYVVNRPAWQRAVLVCSSIPVAILCNLIRLVATAILFMLVSGRIAERFFHDFAGWSMMPLAVFMLVGELWIMSRLIVEDKGEQPQARM